MPVEPKKILIVDDENDIVEQLREYLSEEGYAVEVALDGNAAVEKIDSFMPHIVLLDLKLPNITGIDILKYIRSLPREIHVIVSTGYVDQALIDEAESLGRDAYIQKPFDLETIKKEIDKIILNT